MTNLKTKLVPCGIVILGALALSACNTTSDVTEKRAMVPADKFDLSKWKITIPTDINNDGKVDEISVKDIQSYQHPDYFFLDDEGNMVFAVPNKAFTTPNSSNTRSELHQLLGKEGVAPYDYSNNFALKAHTKTNEFAQVGGNLQATLKVNHVAKRAKYPEKPPAFSVVVGQIHAGKSKALVAEGEGYGWGNEPLKIYYKKLPGNEYGSVFWNYERNLEKENPNRQDISYVVWGKPWTSGDEPGEQGIALNEAFSYEVNVYENTMYLTFSNERHGETKFEINLADNIDANGKVDELDHPHGYTGDLHFFKAGAYNQCSTKDAPGIWYANCAGTGDWETDKANGDYAQVTFTRLVTGLARTPEK